jgi:hypothetical protein
VHLSCASGIRFSLFQQGAEATRVLACNSLGLCVATYIFHVPSWCWYVHGARHAAHGIRGRSGFYVTHASICAIIPLREWHSIQPVSNTGLKPHVYLLASRWFYASPFLEALKYHLDCMFIRYMTRSFRVLVCTRCTACCTRHSRQERNLSDSHLDLMRYRCASGIRFSLCQTWGRSHTCILLATRWFYASPFLEAIKYHHEFMIILHILAICTRCTVCGTRYGGSRSNDRICLMPRDVHLLGTSGTRCHISTVP